MSSAAERPASAAGGVRSLSPPPWVLVLSIAAAFALVSWSMIERLNNPFTEDSKAFRDYVTTLDTSGHLPTPQENYEYSLPVGLPAIGVIVERVFRHVEPVTWQPLLFLPRLLRRLVWLSLVVSGGLLVAGAPVRSPRWLAGAAAWLAATVWAATYVLAAALVKPWLELDLPTLAAGVGLVVATAVLAREVWPDRRAAPVMAAAIAAVVPTIFSISLVFHPDPLFALLGVVALILALRATRRGWSVQAGIVTGALLGASALVRQSAPIVIVSVGVAALLIGRRRAWPFLAAAAAAVALVAGPWWLYQEHRFGNPLQSNLNRPGYMLDHEPLSFYVSFPHELITRPYVPSFTNQLLPRFHAYIWSDWTGDYHNWDTAGHAAKVLASVQSVLGFGGDVLALGGLVLLGAPALARVLHSRSTGRTDDAFASMTILFAIGWIAFLAQLVRFPQHDGDPIKPHYLLFLAPLSAVFALAWSYRLWAKGGWRRGVLGAYAVAYVASWAAVLTVAV